jgi:acyl-CoA synthetase (AMP-forming)/AMP-acid ligase II
VVVFKPGASATPDEVLSEVRQQLAKYKHPRRLLVLPQLPKTALGKVQKDLLVRQVSALLAETAAAPSADSPRSP